MGERLSHDRSNSAYGWNGHYQHEEAGSAREVERFPLALVVIDDDGQAKSIGDSELAKQGLGHIVTAGMIPAQRKAPKEESIPKPEETGEERERFFAPDPSIYLG